MFSQKDFVQALDPCQASRHPSLRRDDASIRAILSGRKGSEINVGGEPHTQIKGIGNGVETSIGFHAASEWPGGIRVSRMRWGERSVRQDESVGNRRNTEEKSIQRRRV